MGELWLENVTYWKELDNLEKNSLSLFVTQEIQFIIWGMVRKREKQKELLIKHVLLCKGLGKLRISLTLIQSC